MNNHNAFQASQARHDNMEPEAPMVGFAKVRVWINVESLVDEGLPTFMGYASTGYGFEVTAHANIMDDEIDSYCDMEPTNPADKAALDWLFNWQYSLIHESLKDYEIID